MFAIVNRSEMPLDGDVTKLPGWQTSLPAYLRSVVWVI